jgi:hypothetical protein
MKAKKTVYKGGGKAPASSMGKKVVSYKMGGKAPIKSYANGGPVMPDKPKIKRAELRQAKAEYKMLKKAAPSGDAEYDKFSKQRDEKRDKIAAGTKVRGKNEKMSETTAAYCGKGGCFSNPVTGGDGSSASVTKGTNTQVRGGRSYRETGKGTLKSNQKKQKKSDIQALALASHSGASEYDINRGEIVKGRLGLQAASRERVTKQAFNKKKKGDSTL